MRHRLTSLLAAATLAMASVCAHAAQQTIGIGAPNSGQGDALFTAFTKVNADFTDLYQFLYAPITGPVTITANTSAIGNGVVTNGNLAPMPALTIKCNFLNSPGVATDCTQTQIAAAFSFGSGGASNITLSAPLPFTVLGSPGTNLTLGYLPGQAADQFLATPCGFTGALGLRALCAADMPAVMGPVTVTAGVSAIAASAVTLANIASQPAATIPCNLTGGVAALQPCTKAQVNTLLGTSGGGSGGQSNVLDMCSYPGIDPTGVTDSGAAVKAAFAAIAGTTTVGLVNCPIKIAIGYNAAAPVFVHSGTNLNFTPTGRFLVDNNTIAAFLFLNTQNCIWNNAQIEYVGAVALNNAVAPTVGVAGSFNDTQEKAELTSQGYVFSGGGSNLWEGPTNAAALLVIRGAAKHLVFNNLRLFVPDTANATQFIPTAISIDAEWLCCTVTTNSNPVTATYAAVPADIEFLNPVIDGAMMGFVSTTGGAADIVNPVFLRYTDLQDASYLINGTGGCQGASCNAGSGYEWMAPPHALYLQNGDNSFCAVSHNHIVNGYDYGIYVGGTTRRSANSGTLLSLKIDATCGTVVDGYVSLRPDGLADVINNYPPNSGGELRNIFGLYNSAIVTLDGTHNWGVRFPSAGNYVNQVFDNWTIIDTAASPPAFPILGNGYASNADVVFNNLKVYQNEWNNYNPGFQFGGTGISVQAEYHYPVSASGTTQYLGPIDEQGATYCVQCNWDIKLFGWRQFAVTFSAALGAGATGGTLLTQWQAQSGLYQLFFQDGETRWVTFTNGSTALSAWAALTGAVTAAGNTAGGALGLNFNGYKPSVSLYTTGTQAGTGSRGHIVDVSNGYEIACENDGCLESLSFMFAGAPASGSTNFAVPGMVLPATMAVDRKSARVTGTLNSNFNLGFAGAATALFSNVSSGAGANPTTPVGTFIANPGQVYMAPTAGSFNGTGNVFLMVRGAQMMGAQ